MDAIREALAQKITRLEAQNKELVAALNHLREGLQIIAGTNYGIDEAKNIARRLLAKVQQ